MDLVEFPNEVFDKAFVKTDKTDVLVFLMLAWAPDDLGFKQQLLMRADFKFEVFAHQVGQKCANLDFHLFAHRRNIYVINQEMFF